MLKFIVSSFLVAATLLALKQSVEPQFTTDKYIPSKGATSTLAVPTFIPLVKPTKDVIPPFPIVTSTHEIPPPHAPPGDPIVKVTPQP